MIRMLAISLLALSLYAQGPQKGIHVDLPAAPNAMTFPDADNADAQIITVTRDGGLFFGSQPMTWSQLETKIMDPRKGIFIKADALAPYATVIKLAAALNATLLTQPETSSFGKRIPTGVTVHGASAQP